MYKTPAWRVNSCRMCTCEKSSCSAVNVSTVILNVMRCCVGSQDSWHRMAVARPPRVCQVTVNQSDVAQMQHLHVLMRVSVKMDNNISNMCSPSIPSLPTRLRSPRTVADAHMGTSGNISVFLSFKSLIVIHPHIHVINTSLDPTHSSRLRRCIQTEVILNASIQCACLCLSVCGPILSSALDISG